MYYGGSWHTTLVSIFSVRYLGDRYPTKEVSSRVSNVGRQWHWGFKTNIYPSPQEVACKRNAWTGAKFLIGNRQGSQLVATLAFGTMVKSPVPGS